MTTLIKNHKIYIIFNWVALMIIIYLSMLPIISPFLNKYFPHVWSCAYLNITGNPCPFCGITRDFISLIHFNFDLINTQSLVLFVFVIFEFLFRIIIIIINKKLKEKTKKLLIILDIIIHSIFISYLIIYIILFFIS